MRLIGRVAGILAVTLMIGSFALVGAAAAGATTGAHTGDRCAPNARSSGCTTTTTAAPPTTVPPTTTTKPKPTSTTTTTVKPPGGAVQPTTTTTAPPPAVAAPPDDPAPPADTPAGGAPSNTGSAGSSGVGTALAPAIPGGPPSGTGVPNARGALDVPPLPGAVLTDDSVLIPGSIALMIAAAGLGMLFLVMQGAAGRGAPAGATVPVDDGRTLEFQ